jgi:peptidoglycan/LPS O-acetylase OafA/YrhL
VVWLNGFVEGLFYLCLPLFIFTALVVVFRLSRANAVRNAALVASACVALPYAHHTFSRADYVHLAHSVPVLALGIIGLCHFLRPSPKSVAVAAVALCFASAPATFVHGGLYAELSAPAGTFVERQVLGQTMHVGLYHHILLTLADRVANKMAKPEEPVVFLPHWPGLCLQ